MISFKQPLVDSISISKFAPWNIFTVTFFNFHVMIKNWKVAWKSTNNHEIKILITGSIFFSTTINSFSSNFSASKWLTHHINHNVHDLAFWIKNGFLYSNFIIKSLINKEIHQIYLDQKYPEYVASNL